MKRGTRIGEREGIELKCRVRGSVTRRAMDNYSRTFGTKNSPDESSKTHEPNVYSKIIRNLQSL